MIALLLALKAEKCNTIKVDQMLSPSGTAVVVANTNAHAFVHYFNQKKKKKKLWVSVSHIF